MLQKQGNNEFLYLIAKWMEVVAISVLLLFFGKTLFVPLLFGLLIAFVSYPGCRWLESKHWPRSAAIALLMFFVIILFLVLLAMLGYELNIFLRDIPGITDKIGAFAPEIQNWLSQNAGIDAARQSDWLRKIILNMQGNLNSSFKPLFNATVSTFFMVIMIPVYASLFLYHRGTFVKFMESILGETYHKRLHVIIDQSIFTYFKFVKGTFFVYLIVGALNSTGLLILGIRHAILYGMLTAFMTIIPYLGIIISASIPVAIALLTKDSLWYPVAVILIFSFVQYLEANVIFPRVVGEQLNLSTLATLIGIIAGAILWGVAGMILFIPMLAILKLITDHVDDLKSLNILLSRKYGYKMSKK